MWKKVIQLLKMQKASQGTLVLPEYLVWNYLKLFKLIINFFFSLK